MVLISFFGEVHSSYPEPLASSWTHEYLVAIGTVLASDFMCAKLFAGLNLRRDGKPGWLVSAICLNICQRQLIFYDMIAEWHPH